MSILKSNFIKKDYVSPIIEEKEMKISYDEDGREVVTYEKVNFHDIIASNGRASDWSLQSLIKAGIDPNFPIHTGNPTRLDGLDTLDRFTQAVEDIFKDDTPTTDTITE